jgi:hypothetical protein
MKHAIKHFQHYLPDYLKSTLFEKYLNELRHTVETTLDLPRANGHRKSRGSKNRKQEHIELQAAQRGTMCHPLATVI